jgi:hypothetical protein
MICPTCQGWAKYWNELLQEFRPCPDCLGGQINCCEGEAARPSFTCPNCHRVSYNANDIREGYCGACHQWV